MAFLGHIFARFGVGYRELSVYHGTSRLDYLHGTRHVILPETG
jgi:hypothetical protein